MLSGFAANPGVPNAATGDAAAKVLARHPSALLVRCRECDVLDRRLQIEQGRVARRVLRSAIEQRKTDMPGMPAGTRPVNSTADP